MLMGQWVKHSFWEEKRRNQAHKEEGKRNLPLLAHPLHSVCPNYPFPFTLEHLPGRLKLGPHVSLSVDTDGRLTFDPDFFVYRYSFPLLILTTSGHFRALIILFNGEVKLIVKISFLNTVHPLSGAYLVQTHLRRGCLIVMGDLLERGKSSFNLAKMVVWVLHKDLECQVEKLNYKKLEFMQLRIKNKSKLPTRQ